MCCLSFYHLLLREALSIIPTRAHSFYPAPRLCKASKPSLNSWGGFFFYFYLSSIIDEIISWEGTCLAPGWVAVSWCWDAYLIGLLALEAIWWGAPKTRGFFIKRTELPYCIFSNQTRKMQWTFPQKETPRKKIEHRCSANHSLMRVWPTLSRCNCFVLVTRLCLHRDWSQLDVAWDCICRRRVYEWVNMVLSFLYFINRTKEVNIFSQEPDTKTVEHHRVKATWKRFTVVSGTGADVLLLRKWWALDYCRFVEVDASQPLIRKWN